MQVGIFSESYAPIVNGVTTSVKTLIAELESAGHTVHVFTSHYPGHTDDRPNTHRYFSVNSVIEPNYVLPIPFSRRIDRIIAGIPLDIVHSQSPFMLGLVARRVAMQKKIPLISTNHTLYTEYVHYAPPVLPRGVIRRGLVAWMRWYYDQCDHVVAPSETTKTRLISGYGVRTPVTVIPTGIPAPPYLFAGSSAVRKNLGLPDDARVLLYVGRLAREKNLEALMRAFELIARRSDKAYMVLAGSGNSAKPLQRMAQELGLADRIVFTGFVNRTKLDPLYQMADVFVFPSKTETQGLVIGEALASGTPAVVVNAGGSAESVVDGEDGFLVPDDAGAIAERVLQLLNDPALRKRMSESGRAKMELLTPGKVAGRVLALYESLVDRKAVSASVADMKPGFEAPRDI